MTDIIDSIWNYELSRFTILDLRGLVFGLIILIISLILAFIVSLIIYQILFRFFNWDWLTDHPYLFIISLTLISTFIIFNNFESIPILEFLFSEIHQYIIGWTFLVFILIITIGLVISFIGLIAGIIIGLYIVYRIYRK